MHYDPAKLMCHKVRGEINLLQHATEKSPKIHQGEYIVLRKINVNIAVWWQCSSIKVRTKNPSNRRSDGIRPGGDARRVQQGRCD